MATVFFAVFAALLWSGGFAQNNGDLRLAGSEATSTQGRVEIFLNGEWGTISLDNSFDSFAANTVCRQLGYYTFLRFEFASVTFGTGTGQIWLSSVDCLNLETDHILRCGYSNPPSNDTHQLDVAVYCETDRVWDYPSNGYIRIADQPTGVYTSAGVLEVYLGDGTNVGGSWGIVCTDYFEIWDATSACRQLGYTGAAGYSSQASSEQAWIDTVYCYYNHSCFRACYDFTDYTTYCINNDQAVTISCTFNVGDAGLPYGTNDDCSFFYGIPYWVFALVGVIVLFLFVCGVVCCIVACCTLSICPLAASRRQHHYQVIQ